METQKIIIKNDFKLANIIYEIENGLLRIPQFQREFIWDIPKILKLLESIYKEYPIGSFFFWDAPKKYYYFCRDIGELGLPKPDEDDRITFVLDGQQRLTALYVTVKGLLLKNKKNYKTICFDLDEKVFVSKKIPDTQRFISLSELLSDDHFDIFNGLTEERKKAFHECYQRFINYPFPAIEVREKELNEVAEIFERINQGGQKLNLFDLVAASTWAPDFDLRSEVNEENEKYKASGFGEIDNEIFAQTLSFIAKGSCTRIVQLELKTDDAARYWKDTTESISLAVDYLRHNLGVINFLFMPYNSMIAVIAYLFFKNKSRALNTKQTELLDRWFWHSTFSERYSVSTLSQLTEDRKLMDKIASGEDLTIDFIFNLNINMMIQIKMFRKSAIKNGVLCLLAKRNPKHLKNNVPLALEDAYYSDFNSPQKHHIFPKSIIQKQFPKNMVSALPNFCFLPAELNKEISNKKPSKYFEEYNDSNKYFEDTLKTHLINYDDSIKQDNFMSFLASRASLILEEITNVTGSKLDQIIAGDINKAIDEVETQLRDFLHERLSSKMQNYWHSLIPDDIVAEVKDRLKDSLSKNPSKTINDFAPRDWFDFCDIMDYQKIIQTNWNIFAPIFRSKMDTQNRFLNFKEYRNAVKHNREKMVSFIKKEGEAALEWLYIILNNAGSDNKPKNGMGGENTQPRFYNGKAWHLEKRCSPQTSETLLKIDNIIINNFKVEGPEWNQKNYVAYRINNFNWLAIGTHKKSLVLHFIVKAGIFNQQNLAKGLGVEQFNENASLPEKWDSPSYVFIKSRGETTDRIKIRIKKDFDLNSEAFLDFLKDAYEAFPK